MNPLQEEILALLAQHQGGLSSQEIRNGLKEPSHLRTVQRRLSALLAGQQITAAGKGKATIYKLSAPTTTDKNPRRSNSSQIEESYEAYIPLSEPGREIYSYVNRPRAGRTPVGYERDFLDAYAPNETWYLGKMTRKHLRQIGDAGVLEKNAFGKSSTRLPKSEILLSRHSSSWYIFPTFNRSKM
jgi:hypothetical protein